MNDLVLSYVMPFHHRRPAREVSAVQNGAVPPQPSAVIPRLARLMALAIRFDELVRSGAISNYAELARLGHVSRARITQIANLVHLAPDIQEELLFLGPDGLAASSICLRHLQPLTALLDWRHQRRAWRKLRRRT
jgi:hypothetical protein